MKLKVIVTVLPVYQGFDNIYNVPQIKELFCNYELGRQERLALRKNVFENLLR